MTLRAAARLLLALGLAGTLPSPASAIAPSADTTSANPTSASPVSAIPPFARRYRTTCASCHTAAPKLNAVGEAFRLHGYRLKRFDEAIGQEPGLPLGDDGWRGLWPRGIWPGEIPSGPPVALRIQADVVSLPAGRKPSGVQLRLPHEVYFLAAASLGDGLAAFIELTGEPGESFGISQAKLIVTDPIRALPHGALNLWIGRQNPYLFTFADRQIDRAGVLVFAWQSYRVADLRLTDPVRPDTLKSPNAFSLGQTLPAVELNGVLRGRTFYSIGVAQGAGPGQDDNNQSKDFYYKVRHKWGGLRLDGEYDVGAGPPPGGNGQLRDHAIIVEHFGYFGEEPGTGSIPDRHRSFGANVRVVRGPLDVGIGAVTRRDKDPWGTGAAAEMRSRFAKGEYLFWPWLAGSLKLEQFNATSPVAQRAGYTRGADERVLVAPGIVALLRQNARLVIEGEFYARERSSAEAARRRSVGLWTRLDVTF